MTHDFWTRTGGGSLIAPMALAHPLHPIDNRSRNRRRNLWVGCVSSWWPLFPSRSSVLIYIYAFSIWVLFWLMSSVIDYTHARFNSTVSSVGNQPIYHNAMEPVCDDLLLVSNPVSADNIASDTDGLVNCFGRMLQNGEFWLWFDIVKSPKDGHCIMHSLKTCLSCQTCMTTHDTDLIEMLIWECKNSDKYLPNHYVGDINQFYSEMEQYVRYKLYNTRFCDIIPIIMSTVLNTIIIIID